MSSITLRNVNKIYPNNVHAVFDFNIDIKDKEFIVFVGPSGCGKSTTLRMIAGLEEISTGEFYIDGKLMNYVLPKDRNVAMVFQNYALYPHMSVYRNMAYGIRIRREYRPIYGKNEKTDALLAQLRNQKRQLLETEKKMVKHLDDAELKSRYDETFAEIEKTLQEIMDQRIAVVGKDSARISRTEKELKKDRQEISYVKEMIEKEKSFEGKERDEEFLSMLEKDLQDELIQAREKEELLSRLKTEETEILKYRRLYDYEVDYEVFHAASILGLSNYLSRKPSALSGGQRQRVALGRAIVRRPKVFLMDEPLSNLDAKLRVQTRAEIASIHKKVGATTIYVTHDQTEAMTLADRIVIMKDGYVQQIGSPMTCFNDPDNMFVAGFIGSPAMNFINGRYENGKFTAENIALSLSEEQQKTLASYEGREIVLGVRPDNLAYQEKGNDSTFDVIVNNVELLGNEFILYCSFGEQKMTIKTNFLIAADETAVRSFSPQMDKIYFFDKETTCRIR